MVRDVDDDNSPSAVFPKPGVRLSYLVTEFFEECGGKEALKGLTTEEACEQFIKPKTLDLESSYCDKLKAQGRTSAYGETAQVFISHAHQCEFLTVLDALEWHLKDQLDIVIWFDIFSMNQHRPMDWTFDLLRTTFQSAIQDFGHLIMVMSPWDDPVPYTRAWCIFEVYCADLLAENKFEIAMGEKDRRKFLEDIMVNGNDCVKNMLATVQAEKSMCSVKEDQENIFQIIQSTIGFAEIDSKVFEQYRDWVIKVAKEALEHCDDTKKKLDLIHAIGSLYLGQGKHEEASLRLHQSFEERRSFLGADHIDTLQSMEYLGQLYFAEGNYSKARPLYMECLKRRQLTLGDENPATLAAMNHLAVNYYRENNYDKAHPLYLFCYESRQTKLGKDHPDTLTSMNNLAALYYKQEHYGMAQPLYEECLESRKTVLGDQHPDTLNTINNVALLYTNQGKYDMAHPLHEECHKSRKIVLGEKHPCTLSSLYNLGKLHEQQGNYETAHPLYKECYEHRKIVLGDEHPNTLKTKDSLDRMSNSHQTALIPEDPEIEI